MITIIFANRIRDSNKEVDGDDVTREHAEEG